MSAGRELEKHLKARRKAYESNNLIEAASICNIIGVHYTEQGDHEKALRYHREELHLSESINDKVGVAVAHRKVGECLADLCQFSKSLEQEELYLNIAQSLDNKEEIQRAYATIGRVWYMKYKSDSSQNRVGGAECLDKARQAFLCGLKSCDDLEGIIKEKEVTEMRARLYLNLGLLAEEQKDIETAEQYYQKTCQLGKDSSLYPLVWQSLFNLGELLVNTNTPNRALIAYEESLRYAQMIKSKQQQADSLLQIATAHIQLVDFLAAKQHLKKALKLDMWTDDDYHQVVFKYKVVCKVLHLSSNASNVPVDCVEDKMKLYDQLGDMCAHKNVQFYNAAIKFYKMELQLAEDHGVEPKQLSQIYFSLAETHCDNGQYTDALHYYENELKTWQDHPTEAATTWVNIARVHEAAQERSKVMEAYNRAIDLATIGCAYNVLRNVFQSMIAFCENYPELEDERVQRSDDLSHLMQEHPEINEPENSPSLQEATPLNTQDMNEELLLSSSGSEDEEEVSMINSTHTRQLRGVAVRKKSKVSKKNEKGETPLHVACIEGHLTRVQQLISDGADINARDNCGWTPLHEASNHGYIDIVRCLLDNGANINDCGGEHCQQTSVLMDAVVNGHIDVVSLLIERGTNLSLKNDKGITALGLVEKYITEHKECDEHITIRDMLEQEMVHQGLQLLVDEARQLRGGAKKGRHCSFNKKGVVNDEDTPPIAVVHPLPHHEPPALLPSPSLIDDEEGEESDDCQLVDNWLLDDMGPPHKRRKTHRQTNTQTVSRSRSLDNVTSTLRGTQSSGRGHPEHYSRHSDSIDSGRSRSERHSRCNNSIDSGCGPSWCESNDPINDEVEPQLWDDNDVIMMQSDMPSYFNDVATPTFPEQCYTQLATQPSVLRVKVHMESSIYLVPCPWQQEDGSNTTVDWLIKKTSERYFMQHGRQPIISLTSQGGALLCPTDPVCQVLQEGEEVVGVVDRWETPPLHEHYQNVCERFKSGVHSKVLEIFQTFSSSSLDLNNIGLHATHLPTLSHTLLAQSTLTSLNLSGNLLTDASCHHLTGLLHNLTLLHNLDLSCTGLTHQGLLFLAQLPSGKPINHAKISLQCLNLSYNNLGPCSGSSLSQFLSLTPNLSHLYLEDCSLSDYTLEFHTGLLNALKSLDKLQILSLAYNIFNNSNYILSWLNNVPLTTLNMTSCLCGFTSSNSIKLTSSMVHLNFSCCQLGDNDITYLTSSLSSLSHLQSLILSGNDFTTLGALYLSKCLPHLSNLTQIDLSGNSNLGNDGCLTIMESLLKITQVRQVTFMSCGLKSPLPKEFYMCVEKSRWNVLDISANPIINNSDKSKLLTYSTIVI